MFLKRVLLSVSLCVASICHAQTANPADDERRQVDKPIDAIKVPAPHSAPRSTDIGPAVQPPSGQAVPGQVQYYRDAAQSFRRAAEAVKMSPADDAAKREHCYNEWAGYYDAMADRLRTGGSISEPAKPACDPFAQEGVQTNDVGAGPDEVRATAPTGASPAAREYVRSLNLLADVFRRNQEDVQRRQEEDAKSQAWKRNAAVYWDGVAKRVKAIESDPDFKQFDAEQHRYLELDAEQLANSLRTGDAQSDLAASQATRAAQVYRTFESDFARWKVEKVRRDAADAARNLALANDAATSLDAASPTELHQKICESLLAAGGSNFHYSGTAASLMVVYTGAKDEGARISLTRSSVTTDDDPEVKFPPAVGTDSFTWDSFRDAEITLSRNYEARSPQPFILKIQFKKCTGETKWQEEGNNEVHRTELADEPYEWTIYLKPNEERASRLAILFKRLAAKG